jgi:hypothetical protein
MRPWGIGSARVGDAGSQHGCRELGPAETPARRSWRTRRGRVGQEGGDGGEALCGRARVRGAVGLLATALAAFARTRGCGGAPWAPIGEDGMDPRGCGGLSRRAPPPDGAGSDEPQSGPVCLLSA